MNSLLIPVLILVLVAGIAIGVLTYSNVLSSSVERTADAKALLSVGSDAVAANGSLPSVSGSPPFEWTPVETLLSIYVNPGGRQVTLVAIDPKSFARAAAWIGPFSGPPAVLRSLDDGGPLPAITVGTSLGRKSSLAMRGQNVPLRAVGSMAAFPGVLAGHPTLIVDRQRLEAAAPSLEAFDRDFQLWARGDPAEILPVLAREGFDPTFFITAEGQRETPGFLALSWTFGLLQTFGALAGVMSVLGAVLYLQARQQQREVTYALARRMGLGRKEHRRSIALELGGMLAAAFVIGAVFATAAAAIVPGKVDPLPTLPPGAGAGVARRDAGAAPGRSRERGRAPAPRRLTRGVQIAKDLPQVHSWVACGFTTFRPPPSMRSWYSRVEPWRIGALRGSISTRRPNSSRT